MKNAVCYFFAYFAEAVILWQYASTLFIPASNTLKFAFLSSHSQKEQKRRMLLTLIFLYMLLFCISLMEIRWLNAAAFLLANFVYLYTLYQLRWFSALFHAAILTAVMGTCELILYGIMLNYYPRAFSISLYPHYLAILTIFSKILYFFITYISGYFIKKRRSRNEAQTLSSLPLCLVPVTAIFVMLTFISISEQTALPPSSDWMIILCAMLLLSISLLVFVLNQYNQKKHAQYTEALLLLQKESDTAKYYEMLLSQHDDQSILIHDIKKHLQSIDLLNDRHDHEKISAYIKQLLLSSDLQDAARLCDHALLNAILCRYKKQCSALHITFLTDIRSGTVHFMEDNDITSLFCNLLDNAVEACRDIPEAFIELTIQKREKTPFVVITAVNSCRKDPFSDRHTSRMQRLTTSKPDKKAHGFGIKSIRKAVSKYRGEIQMYYKDDTASFHSIITLKQIRH